MEDHSGKKYGVYTALSFSHRKGNRYYWNCECICGFKLIKDTSTLWSPGIAKKCQHKYGDIKANRIYTMYRSVSKRKRRAFELTKSQVTQLVKSPCDYCGESLDYNGIDRVDNKKGYTLSNVVPCCSKCNYAKRDLHPVDFKNWIHTLVNFQIKSNPQFYLDGYEELLNDEIE